MSARWIEVQDAEEGFADRFVARLMEPATGGNSTLGYEGGDTPREALERLRQAFGRDAEGLQVQRSYVSAATPRN